MIYILFISSLIIVLLAFQKSKLRLMSPTFWASLMFTIFSGVYVLTYNTMRSDISADTLIIIIGGLLVVSIGEYAANHTTIRLSKSQDKKRILVEPFKFDSRELCISKWKTIVVAIVYFILVFIRWQNFKSIASAYGSFWGFMGMMTNARLSLETQDMVLSNGYLNQIGMVCEVASYIFLFVFMYNLVRFRKFRLYLLLPLIPDFINRIMTTTRSAFLSVFVAILTCYFIILVKENKVKRILFSRKLMIGIAIFFVVFLWYGRARNVATEIPITSYVQMYSCAAIYNLNYTVVNHWDISPMIGWYTLRRLYYSMGLNDSLTFANQLRNITFSTQGYHSNIYTSLFQPIQDYGIAGMLIIRLIEAFFITKLIRKQLSRSEDDPTFYTWMFFMMIAIYAYAMYPVGNRFGDYLGNPWGMIRYLIYGWLLVKFFISPYMGNVVLKRNNSQSNTISNAARGIVDRT